MRTVRAEQRCTVCTPQVVCAFLVIKVLRYITGVISLHFHFYLILLFLVRLGLQKKHDCHPGHQQGSDAKDTRLSTAPCWAGLLTLSTVCSAMVLGRR